jgi:NADPH2:quinone reductase
MFARAIFETADILAQQKLLNEVSALVDAGLIRSALTETLGTINAMNLNKPHALIESGRARGNLVSTAF